MTREETRRDCFRVLDTIINDLELATLWPILRYIVALEEDVEQKDNPDPILADIYKKLNRLSDRVDGSEGLKRAAMEAEAHAHEGVEP